VGDFTKQEILNIIRETAKENGGKPLGKKRLQKETDLSEYHWSKYWARLSDAHKEAGFAPNKYHIAYDDAFLIEQIIGKIRKLGRYPTIGELRLESLEDTNFPYTAIKRRKNDFVLKVAEYCESKTGYDDILNICKPRVEALKKKGKLESMKSNKAMGEVYLYKVMGYYKIGKTFDSVRRGKEISLQLPEKTTLIHSIKTCDPSGIEAYWHKRFEAKRGKGEWFNLNSYDVKEFKQWKRIV